LETQKINLVNSTSLSLQPIKEHLKPWSILCFVSPQFYAKSLAQERSTTKLKFQRWCCTQGTLEHSLGTLGNMRVCGTNYSLKTSSAKIEISTFLLLKLDFAFQ